MSSSFILTGQSSVLSYDFNPPIYLEEGVDYEIGLVNFDSFYSIPNVDDKSNTFLWWDESGLKHEVQIPTGAYEINSLLDAMKREILKEDEDAVITTEFDMNTAKVIIRTNRKLSFNVSNSLGTILGYGEKDLPADYNSISDSPVQILKVNAICIDCNIAASSYLNGRPVHIIHQFFPTVSPGYKIVETPLNTIYYPVTLRTINNITVRIIDQEGELVNFLNEMRTVRLHLRKII